MLDLYSVFLEYVNLKLSFGKKNKSKRENEMINQ